MNGEGFHDDCISLIQSYCDHKSTDFNLFCDEWKKKCFYYVFFGFSNHHELVLYTENYFVIVKNIFVNSTSASERLATLYLMYGLYFKQPAKDFCKFRLTLCNWNKMRNFYNVIHNGDQYQQARAIFWRLWYADAFRFVETDIDYQPDIAIGVNSNDDTPDGFFKINLAMLNRVNEWQDGGILNGLEALDVGYNEMKEHLVSTSACALTVKQSVNDIMQQVDNIKALFSGMQNIKANRSRASAQNLAAKPNTLVENDMDTGDEFDSSSSPNDSSESIEIIDDMELDIGARRYEIKRKALNETTDQLTRFRGSVMDMNKQPLKEEVAAIERSIESNENRSVTNTDDKKNVVPATRSIVHVAENGDIIINHPKKVFNRYPKSYVRKQILSCPDEASAEIDGPMKRSRKQ